MQLGLLMCLAAASTGGVRGFVFTGEGLPIPNVRVVHGDATVAHTDREGMFFVVLPPGDHRFLLEAPGLPAYETVPVPVNAGQDSEFIVVLRKEGARVEVEAPKGPITSTSTLADDTRFGLVRGKVVDAEKGGPIEGARIFVRGTGVDARSDEQGEFTLRLPIGAQELTVIHPRFSTEAVPSVSVSQEVTAEVSIELAKKSIELAEMVITSPKIEGSTIYVLEERKDSSNVQDVLGADQISKAGDSDAAGALKRVTGVTVVGGRFVYVRGLGERYSSTLLNGATLPSPDPERRVVPLDLFPAGVISSIVVQKTYSPDLPGEFGGGTVLLRTKDIPESFTAKLGVSTGYLSSTTFQSARTYEGGRLDFLGFGGRSRALPDELAGASATARIEPGNQFTEGFSQAEIERFGESLDLSYGTTDLRAPPPVGVSAEIGSKFSLLGAKAGGFAAFNWGNDRFNKQTRLTTYGVDNLLTDYRIQDLQTQVTLAAIGTAGVDFTDHDSVRASLSVNRISEDSTRITRGFLAEQDTDVDITRLRWVEQMLITSQLRGEHVLTEASKLKLDWSYMFSTATRDEPNRREIRYDLDPTADRYFFSLRTSGNQRFYSELRDRNHDLRTDLTLPVRLFGDVETRFSGGLAGTFKNRRVSARRYRYDLGGSAEERAAIRALGPDQIFGAETIDPDLFELEEVTLPDDNYLGSHELVAGYLMTDLGILNNLSVQAGARLEWSKQLLQTRDPVAAAGEEEVAGELQTIDVLPAVTATWEVVEDMQIRLAFGRTINRPNFRELSPARFFDISSGFEFRGNPELDRALITHADLRWEWYPSPGESLSVAGFFKTFENAIENTITSGANRVFTPANVEARAYNFGGEVEVRKNFGFVAGFLEDLYVASNFTLVSSTVDLSGLETVATSKRRPLQGQSPFAINAQLGYDNVETETSVAVLFNVFGRRIDSVGSEGVPDVYEEPVPTLDLVATQRWGRVKIGAKLRNILNPAIRLTQNTPEGKRDWEVYRRGFAFSLGLSLDLD